MIDLEFIFDNAYKMLGAVGILCAIYFAYKAKASSEDNKARIQTLSVSVNGRLTQLLEVVSAERFGAGKQTERAEARERAAIAPNIAVETAIATAAVLELARVDASMTLETARAVAVTTLEAARTDAAATLATAADVAEHKTRTP